MLLTPGLAGKHNGDYLIMPQSEKGITALKRLPSHRAMVLQSILVGLFGFVALAGVSGLVYLRSKEALINEIRAGLERTARIAARGVDGEAHGSFVRSEQKTTPAYATAIKPLREIIEADPQVAFAYSAILRDGKVYFVLDATPPPKPGETDQSVDVMEQYAPPPPDLLVALKERKPVVSSEPYTDKWGTFLSAYEPIFDRTKNFIGIVGVDLTTTNYEKRLRPIQRNSWLAALLSAALALVVGLAVYWQRRTDRNLVELARQMRIVNGLLRVSQAMGKNVGLENLLPIIVDKTSEVMNTERSTLFLCDASGRSMRSWRGGVAKAVGATLSSDRGIVGRVVRTGQVANVSNVELDPDFDPAVDLEFGERANNLLAVPVLDNRGRTVAVLATLNRKSNQAFDEDDQTLLAALAAQTQVALEREQLNQSALEKRKLDEALKFAQTIQMGMLPNIFPDPATSRTDLAALLIPAKVVGGDFYDFFELGEDKVGLVIADVSGKGVPAALFMAKSMTLIRALASVGRSPAEVLRAANEELALDNAASMFVTVFIGVLDRARGVLVYANGGHNPPMLVRSGVVSELTDADAVPLGTVGGMEFIEASLQLQPEDLLFMFTDGINEAMDPDNVEFGDPRLRQFLAETSANGASEVIARVINAVRAHARGAEQSDDITVMTLRWITQTGGTLVEN